MKQAVLTAGIALAALAACQTTEGPRTIEGTSVTFTDWRDISESESSFQFGGEDRPAAMNWQYRMRDGGRVLNERVRFASPTSYPISAAYMETAQAGGIFNERSAQHVRDRAAARDTFGKMFGGARAIEVKEGANRNGRFLYAVAEFGPNHCIAAVQGLEGDPMGAYKQLPGDHFQAVVTFSFCDAKSESELLNVFASFRPKLHS